jgi:hypothetical protein
MSSGASDCHGYRHHSCPLVRFLLPPTGWQSLIFITSLYGQRIWKLSGYHRGFLGYVTVCLPEAHRHLLLIKIQILALGAAAGVGIGMSLLEFTSRKSLKRSFLASPCLQSVHDQLVHSIGAYPREFLLPVHVPETIG